MTAMHRLATACLAILLGSAGSAQQPATTANGVTPGELVVEPPTLINLGFEWLIDGDANRNAKVDVSYRKAGDSAWKTGMPLLRLQGERVTQPNVFALVSPNMFAGSILDLEPDTAYEARFVLSDPDGVSGARRERDQDAHRPHASRAEAGRGRQGLSRLSRRLHRREDRAGVHRHHVRLQLLLRRRRHRAGRTAARQSRATPSSSTPAPTRIDTRSTPTRPRSTRRRRSRGRTT